MNQKFHVGAPIAALALTLFCTACGGGGGAAPSVQPAAPTPPVVTPPVVTPPVVTPPVVDPPAVTPPVVTAPTPGLSLFAAAPAGTYWTGIAATPDGNLLVIDTTASTVMKIASTGTVSLLAGGGVRYQDPLDGSGTAARFKDLHSIAVDAAGNAFVADYSQIRKITPAGVVTTLYTFPVGPDNFPKSTSGMWPLGVAVDSHGSVIAATAFSRRRIAPDGKVTMITGDEIIDHYRGSMVAAPIGIAVDVNDNVYFAQDATIRRTDPANVTTALQTAVIPGDVGVPYAGARLSGAAIDTSGRLYVIDATSGALRKLSPNGTLTSYDGLSGTIAGQSVTLGKLDDVDDRGLVLGPNNSLYTTNSQGVIKIQLPPP